MSIFHKRDLLRYLAARFLAPWGTDVPRDSYRVIAGSTRAYGPDVSHWEDYFDPSNASPGLIDFAILKATEGAIWKDDTFESNYNNSAGVVPILGAYHYLRSAYSVDSQAENFYQSVNKKNLQFLVCDFESINNTMDSDFVVKAHEFGKRVKEAMPEAFLFFYTNPSTYDNIVYPGSVARYGRDIFKEYPWDGFWVAQYYFSPNPDKYPAMPASRSDWVMWQYSEAGNPQDHGAGGWVDQNVWNGTPAQMFEFFGNPIPPDPPPGGDIIETWFDDKVIYQKGHRESPRPFNFHVTRFQRSDVERIHVNGLGFQGTGEYFWRTRGEPDIVINGGHADYSVSPPVPFAVVMSDGQLQKSQPDEVSIQFDVNHQPIGMFWFKEAGAYNTVGISAVLLQGGIIPAAVRLNSFVDRVRSILPFVDDTFVDPRNALFWNESEYILIDIDGRNDGTQGVTQLELARFAQSLGALWGGNLDGGDSNTLIFNDAGLPVVKNNPPDGKLHAVANHVGFWIKRGDAPPPDNGGTPMPQETYITTKKAPLYNSNGRYREDIPASTVIVCDWLWPDGPLAGMRKIVSGYLTDGDRFIKDSDIDLYTAPPPPPPTDTTLPDVPYTFTLGDGVNYQKETITGILKAIK